jgi:serine/threonine-protein kinase RsbW
VEIKMVLYLPRDSASVPVSRQVLDGCLGTLGVTPDTRADIALAITEACANAIQHARPAQEYLVQVSASNGRCAIEVVNTGSGDGDGRPGQDHGAERTGLLARVDEPMPVTAEHGRGLKIMNAVVDNLQLTGDERHGVTVHFEKTLDWLPDAPGRYLFQAEDG